MARTQGSHSDITGPRIRKAALGLFARHGYAAVSMRQIAKEVGVQAGALYNYTPDKQSLLYRLMQEHMQDLLAAYGALDQGNDPQDALRRFVGFHIRFHLERPDEVFIAYMELRNLTPENFAEIEELRRTYEDALESILHHGQQVGVFFDFGHQDRDPCRDRDVEWRDDLVPVRRAAVVGRGRADLLGHGSPGSNRVTRSTGVLMCRTNEGAVAQLAKGPALTRRVCS